MSRDDRDDDFPGLHAVAGLVAHAIVEVLPAAMAAYPAAVRDLDLDRWMVGCGPAELAQARAERAAGNDALPSGVRASPDRVAPDSRWKWWSFAAVLAAAGLGAVLWSHESWSRMAGALLIFLLTAGIAWFLWDGQHNAPARRRSLIQAAATRLGGAGGLAHPGTVAAWLERHWPWVAPRDLLARRADEEKLVTSGMCGGRPVLVLAQWRAPERTDHRSSLQSSSDNAISQGTILPGLVRVSLFVAWGGAADEPAAVVPEPALERQGFAAIWTPAGLYAYRRGRLPTSEELVAAIELAAHMNRSG